MTDTLLVRRRSVDDTGGAVSAGDGRTVTVRLCRWNDPRRVDDGDGPYVEQFAPGSIELRERVRVIDQHSGTIIGQLNRETLTDADDGPTVDLELVDSVIADHTLALVRAGVVDSVSMEFAPLEDSELLGVTTRERVELDGVAFAAHPAHDAPVLATRSTTTTTEENPPMTDTLTRAELDEVLVAHRSEVRTELEREFDDRLTRELVRIRDEAAPAPATNPLARFRSLGELYVHAREASPEDRALLHRALVDQISGNNPGVMRPQYISDIAGIIPQERPVITSFGTSPLTSLSVNWPYYDGDVTTLVGEQATEKTEVTSARVDIKQGLASSKTYAGASDVSLQLERYSDPDYMTAYLSLLRIGWAATTEAAASAEVTAAATASSAVWVPATGTWEELLAAFFAASLEVQTATGRPASFALAASDVFQAIGELSGLYPSQYGTQNVAGTADAASLEVNVSGLPVRHGMHLASGTLILSNSSAASWLEDGPMFVQAPNVALLGTDVAVWGTGITTPSLPAGIRSIPAA